MSKTKKFIFAFIFVLFVSLFTCNVLVKEKSEQHKTINNTEEATYIFAEYDNANRLINIKRINNSANIKKVEKEANNESTYKWYLFDYKMQQLKPLNR